MSATTNFSLPYVLNNIEKWRAGMKEMKNNWREKQLPTVNLTLRQATGA